MFCLTRPSPKTIAEFLKESQDLLVSYGPTGILETTARPIEPGTAVAGLIRHLGLWSLNGCHVLYHVEDDTPFGFAYGTLTNHAEAGEELFVVELDPMTEAVSYRIRGGLVAVCAPHVHRAADRSPPAGAVSS